MPPHGYCRRDIYTDGACIDNGKLYARAGIGIYWGHRDPRNLSLPLKGRQSNQRAEIQAVVVALDQAIDSGYEYVRIHTDSKYVIKGITEWIDGWDKNGWRDAHGRPVRNRGDFMELDDLCKQINVAFTHVQAHSGHYENNQADELAYRAANYNDYNDRYY